uniref:Uncharacterized protein n=1 Tax=Plectus sambesii TaxID=2011161 RepID=A0A914V0B8_9BILA
MANTSWSAAHVVLLTGTAPAPRHRQPSASRRRSNRILAKRTLANSCRPLRHCFVALALESAINFLYDRTICEQIVSRSCPGVHKGRATQAVSVARHAANTSTSIYHLPSPPRGHLRVLEVARGRQIDVLLLSACVREQPAPLVFFLGKGVAGWQPGWLAGVTETGAKGDRRCGGAQPGPRNGGWSRVFRRAQVALFPSVGGKQAVAAAVVG